MKLDVAVAGAIGMLIGAGIYQLASAVSEKYPALIAHPIGVAIIFLILLGIALAEIPVMLFGLKKIAASTTPRPFLLGTHLAADIARGKIHDDIVIPRAPRIIAQNNVHRVHHLTERDFDASLFAHFARGGIAHIFAEFNRAAGQAPHSVSRVFAALNQQNQVIFANDHADAGNRARRIFARISHR